MGRDRRIITDSSEETLIFGANLGKELPSGSILCLFGELGAGKTTLVKGIVHGRTGIAPESVVSPTFVYLNIYDSIYHFDLYRLQGADEFLSLGFEEYFFAGGICCIEWSERICSLLPKEAVHITLSHLSENKREITLSQS